MLEKSVVNKCCREVLEKSVGEENCREVLWRSVVVVWYCFCGVVFYLRFCVFVVAFGCVFI